MPELPEITARAKEMKKALVGKTIVAVEILQPKSLNMTREAFTEHVLQAKVKGVTNRGKWILVETSLGWILINLGMGGEILLVERPGLPRKYRICFDFNDQSSLVINFWWFGYVHFVPVDELPTHSMTASLGPNPLNLTARNLAAIFNGSKQRLKTMLLDQTKMAGIGNAYIHDILFLAQLHPLRRVDSLSAEEIERLVEGIHAGLQPSIDKGGAFYEVDIYGKGGGFSKDDILIGYREGEPCPRCQTKIEKIKTGGTSSFICPACQPAS
jgi:formamidopyrimidine-DNA glycosylase